MIDFKQQIASALEKAIALPEMTSEKILALLENPPNPDLGDFAFPCFKLAALLKKAPQHIAVELAAKFGKIAGISRFEVAGAYVNFFVEKQALAEQVVERILKEKSKYGFGALGKQKRLMVEYSAPNTNKPLHVGHLRNDSLGMALSNILGANSFKVIRANLVNDRGIHICKSMLAYQKFGKGKTPKTARQKSDHFVGDYYVLFSKKEKENPGLVEEAQKLLVLWEQRDKKTLALWKKMNSWAVNGMKQTYKEFGSRFDAWFFESKFFDKAKPLIDLGLQKGVFKKDETGAIVADLEQFGLGKKTVLRADGTAIYLTNDLALTKHKFEAFRLDAAYWVVAVEQQLYFQQLFKILELLGFEWAKNCKHVSYEMVHLPEGKMKSREGKVVDANELLSAAKNSAIAELKKRYSLKPAELKKRARQIALSAIKFHLLKIDAGKTMVFDLNKAILFEGETGPFVQYSFARAKSILRKAGKTKASKQLDFRVLVEPQEKEVIKLLAAYPEIVPGCLRQLSVHSLCQFLLDLASAFNLFYHDLPVLKAEPKLRDARLALVEATAIVLSNGLHLLNIDAIDRM